MPSNYVYVGSGGISVGGPPHYTLDIDYEAVSGGLVFGGSADCQLWYNSYSHTMTGGVGLGGSADTPVALSYTGTGGIVLPPVRAVDNDFVGSQNYSHQMSGGVTVAGSAAVQRVTYAYVMSGGILVSGLDNNVGDFAYFTDGLSPVVLGGSADVSAVQHYQHTMSGGVSLGGGMFRTSAQYAYVGSGGVTIGGTSTRNNTITIDVPIGWNTLADIVVDVPIGWNTGETILYFYRVEGVCQSLTCPPISDPDPSNKDCNFSYIKNVVAPNVCDVCTQLEKDRFLRTIKSIKRFSNPAREADIQRLEALGDIDPFCNTLEQEEFCQCPPCAQFCDYESVEQNPTGFTTITTTETQPGWTYVIDASTNVLIDSYLSPDGLCYLIYEFRNNFVGGRDGGTVEKYSFPCPTTTTTTTTAGPTYSAVVSGRVRIGGEAVVVWKPNQIELTADTGVVETNCGCRLPTQVYLTHDLARASKLREFLTGNGYVLPDIFTLSYSKIAQGWTHTQSYVGSSVEDGSRERWTVVAVLECTEVLDGVLSPGNPDYWRLSISVRRQNLDRNSGADTRLQLSMSETGPCERGELSVRAFYNVRTSEVQPIDPPRIALGAVLNDKIGIFQGATWFKNPQFPFSLDVHKSTTSTTHMEFGPIYPQLEISRLN